MNMFADFSLKTFPFITPTTFYLKDKKKKENNNYKDIDLCLQLTELFQLSRTRSKSRRLKDCFSDKCNWKILLIYCFPEELFAFKQIFSRTLTICMEKPEILFFIANDTLYSGEICRVFPLVQRKVTFCILNNIITLLGTIAGKRIYQAKMYLSQLRPSLFFRLA